MKKSLITSIPILSFGIIILFNVLLLRTNNNLNNQIAELEESNNDRKREEILLEINRYENYLQTPGIIQNLNLWNEETSEQRLKNLCNNQRLIVWIAKNSCSSCIIKIIEDIKRYLPQKIIDSIIVIKTNSEKNNLDLSPFGLTFYYTDAPFPLEMSDQSIQIFIGIINEVLQLKMTIIPSTEFETRTIDYIKLLRVKNVFQ